MAIIIDRWIDLQSDDFKRLEHSGWIRQFTLRGIACAAIVPNKDGNLFCQQNGEDIPIHAELDGKIVGLRYACKAAN